jgi:hypothetical protein
MDYPQPPGETSSLPATARNPQFAQNEANQYGFHSASWQTVHPPIDPDPPLKGRRQGPIPESH